MTAGNTDLHQIKIERDKRRAVITTLEERRARREQRRLEVLARIRAAHAAACRPLIDATLLTAAERRDIRARIKHAREPVEDITIRAERES